MAQKTADPMARESRVHECFSMWLAWDPDSAKQWLKGADFSEAVKNRWLSEKPNQGL
jgi:predicted phosphoadenosine phosphosulfate sulfurtransferase